MHCRKPFDVVPNLYLDEIAHKKAYNYYIYFKKAWFTMFTRGKPHCAKVLAYEVKNEIIKFRSVM